MGHLTFIIPDKLEDKFRKRVYEKMGMRKGNLVKSFEEALEDWVKKK